MYNTLEVNKQSCLSFSHCILRPNKTLVHSIILYVYASFCIALHSKLMIIVANSSRFQGRVLLESLPIVLGSHPSWFLHQIRLLFNVHGTFTRFLHVYLLQSWKFYVFFLAQKFKTAKEKCYNFDSTSEICSSAGKLRSQHKTRKKRDTLLEYRIEDASSYRVWKTLVTCGFFTFLTCEQALAGSDVGSSLQQSFPFLGDAGDLSTGFASVRKFSL